MLSESSICQANTDKMQLKTGFYYISTIATSPWGEHWVQRDTTEDKSMLPKAVNIQVDDPGVIEVRILLLLHTIDSLHKHLPNHTDATLVCLSGTSSRSATSRSSRSLRAPSTPMPTQP